MTSAENRAEMGELDANQLRESKLAGRIDQLLGWAKCGQRPSYPAKPDVYILEAEKADRLRNDIIDVIVAELGGLAADARKTGRRPMADPSPDRLAAFLAEVWERTERPIPHVTSLPIGHDGVRTLMESAADVPCLIDALVGVLALAACWERFGDGQDAQSECARELREMISRAVLKVRGVI